MNTHKILKFRLRRNKLYTYQALTFVRTDLNQRRSLNKLAGTGRGEAIVKFVNILDFVDSWMTEANKIAYKEH